MRTTAWAGFWGPPAEWSAQADFTGKGGRYCRGDDQDHPGSGDALERASHGGEPQGQPGHRATDLEET